VTQRFGNPPVPKNTFAVTLAANKTKYKTNCYEHTRNQGDWNITKGKLKQKWAKLTG